MSLNANYEPLTPEKIISELDRLDRIIRPKVLVVNPRLKEMLLEEYPDLEKKIVIRETILVDIDSAYIMDREYFDGGLEADTLRRLSEVEKNGEL